MTNESNRPTSILFLRAYRTLIPHLYAPNIIEQVLHVGDEFPMNFRSVGRRGSNDTEIIRSSLRELPCSTFSKRGFEAAGAWRSRFSAFALRLPSVYRPF